MDSVHNSMNNYKKVYKTNDVHCVNNVDNLKNHKNDRKKMLYNSNDEGENNNSSNDNYVNNFVDCVEKGCGLSEKEGENCTGVNDQCEYIYNDGLRPYIIRTYMVHHLGMSFMALDNVLLDNILINRFHKLPEVKATELLLKEKVSHSVTYERGEDYSIKYRYIESEELVPRTFNSINYKNPQVLLMSNGKYSSMVTFTGSGYSKKEDMILYRYKGDSTADDSGMFFYVKNLNSNDFWSASYEPCKR